MIFCSRVELDSRRCDEILPYALISTFLPDWDRRVAAESQHSSPDLDDVALTVSFVRATSKLRSATSRSNISWRSHGTVLGPNSGG